MTVTLLDDEVQDLLSGRFAENPFPAWNRLREEAPIYRRPDAVIVSRFADVEAMLADQERFSNDVWSDNSRTRAILASFSDEGRRMWEEVAGYEGELMTRKDGDEHDRLRRIVHRFFTPRQVDKLQDVMRAEWDKLLTEAAESEVCDYKSVAQRLTFRVLSHILGFPDVDAPHLMDLADDILLFKTRAVFDEETLLLPYRAYREFNDYTDRVIIAEYRRNPAANEFVRAVMDAEGEENLTAAEMRGLVMTILIGFDNATKLLATGLFELLTHRDQWEWLCEDPEARVPGAIEELIRWISPSPVTMRTTAVDLEFAGEPLRAGQTVMAAIAAANRDPERYERPDTLDVTQGSRPHMGFGFGPKFCVGVAFARTEARIAFTMLAQRFPGVELAATPDELEWLGGAPSRRSIRELPVRLR